MQCSILKPREMRYHYHLSDIAKHHGVFVDHLLCYIIEKYEMKMKVISFRVTMLPAVNTTISIRLACFNN